MKRDIRIALNLPFMDLPCFKQGNDLYLKDPVRKQMVKLLPEEWVRQNMLHFLNRYKNFPFSLMSIEAPIKYGKLNKRADLLVYDKNTKPLLIGEFKSVDVKLSNHTFMQLATYNFIIEAPYLLVSNGLEHYVAKIDFQTKSISFLKDIPSFDELIEEQF